VKASERSAAEDGNAIQAARDVEVGLFHARLDQINKLNHELMQLAGKIDWAWIDGEIAPLRLSAHHRHRTIR
jgi:hypothetical protein